MNFTVKISLFGLEILISLPSNLISKFSLNLNSSSPLGPLTVTKFASPILTVTPAGTWIFITYTTHDFLLLLPNIS